MRHTTHRPNLQHAMQWLLDDLSDAGETHNAQTGRIFDSVEHAAAALIEAGGNLNWYDADDARAYRSKDLTPAFDPSVVERLFKTQVLTTAGIAAALGVSEAAVWNARARSDAHRRSS